MRALKQESIARLILFGEDSLGRTVREFLVHYHRKHNRQGLDNRIIEPGQEVARKEGRIACRKRLGGVAPLLSQAPPELMAYEPDYVAFVVHSWLAFSLDSARDSLFQDT